MPCSKSPFFLWWMFMLFPLNWPYRLQMHNFPCINCVWVNLLSDSFGVFLNGHDSWDEGFSQRTCLYDVLILWCGGEVESMWICASRQASLTVYQGRRRQQPSFESLKVTRVVCKWPLTLTLYLALCVCLSLSARVMTVASAVTSPLSDALPGVKTENQ